ncbi:hypothetical protein QBC35DRAFT_372615 [Podospora australis]|uniref:CASTOR ACT domain-containing protein n=1 Tax=Podospora australis TaxID=1536484 RepID=A0AAN7ALE9_9PEZI|nr:hypothetical protein QBC35DRAFT_372615 [Podospora australis]
MQEGTLSLIHIPLDLYSTFLQSILKVLLPQTSSQPKDDNGDDQNGSLTVSDVPDRHGFLNISVTPIECSIVCHTSWAKTVFEPAIQRLVPKELSKSVSVSKDAYNVFSVTSAGMDAASRVADLTSPLALARIPIFFITTYYSDFVLVPAKDRGRVVEALLARGFTFVEDDNGSSSTFASSSSPTHSRHGSNTDPSSRIAAIRLPSPTTLPSSARELQDRTFENLKKQNVVPYLEPGLRLIHCAGREEWDAPGGYSERPSLSRGGMMNGSHRNGGRGGQTCWADTVDTKLYASLVAALVSQPKFLSVTLAKGDSPSLLLDRNLRASFGDSVIGPTDGSLVPIFLDLVDLPFEATGIVSGVAETLVGEIRGSPELELSYLSTARAGAVILSSEKSSAALSVLSGLLVKESS